MKTADALSFFTYGQPVRTPPSHQNELYAMAPSPFTEASWGFKTALQPTCPSPEPRPRPKRLSSLGMASPLAALPSTRTSAASYVSASTVTASDVDVSRALNIVHSMVSLPGSTARNSLDLAGGGASAAGPPNLCVASSVASSAYGARSVCMSPCSAATGGTGTAAGNVSGPIGLNACSAQPSFGPAMPSAVMQSRPATRSSRPATALGLSTTGTGTGAGVGMGIGQGAARVSARRSSAAARVELGPVSAAAAAAAAEVVTEAREVAEGAVHAKRPARLSIDAAVGAEELATRVVSGTAAPAQPLMFKPKPKPSPLREAKVQRQAAQELLRTAVVHEDDDGGMEAEVPPVAGAFPGFFSPTDNEGGVSHGVSCESNALSSLSSLARVSHTDEWSFGGNLQKARMKARYAAVDVAGELKYLPPSSAGGAGGGGLGGGGDSRKARKAWKVLAMLASKAIGGGKHKQAPAPPPPPQARARPLPRPSMAEEPAPVQRSRDSRRLLIGQRVRVALDGEPAQVMQSQKRAAGPAAAALAAAKKAASASPEDQPPNLGGAAASAAVGGGGGGGEHGGEEGPHDELDAAMHAAAAAFAAATGGELARNASLA